MPASAAAAGARSSGSTVSVDVPAGIDDGQRIRITGRGHAGERGGPAGDLYVQIRVKEDPRFVRHDDELVTVVDVAAPLAALGHDGRGAHARRHHRARDPRRHPARTSRSTIRGQGMPALRGRHRGDLRVIVNVVIPRHLKKEQKELLQQLSDSLTEHNLSTDEGVLGKLKRAFGG